MEAIGQAVGVGGRSPARREDGWHPIGSVDEPLGDSDGAVDGGDVPVGVLLDIESAAQAAAADAEVAAGGVVRV